MTKSTKTPKRVQKRLAKELKTLRLHVDIHHKRINEFVGTSVRLHNWLVAQEKTIAELKRLIDQHAKTINDLHGLNKKTVVQTVHDAIKKQQNDPHTIIKKQFEHWNKGQTNWMQREIDRARMSSSNDSRGRSQPSLLDSMSSTKYEHSSMRLRKTRCRP